MTSQPNTDARLRSPSLLGKSEDDLYAMALNEIQSDTPKKSVWEQAIRKSNGDHQKAKAIYIRLRINQLNKTRLSQQIKHEKIIVDCPLCHSAIPIDTDSVWKCQENAEWEFECPMCHKEFDLLEALPDQAFEVLEKTTVTSSPPVSTPAISNFGPELRNGTIVIIVILALIFGVQECNKFKMQKKISDAYRNHPNQWQR